MNIDKIMAQLEKDHICVTDAEETPRLELCPFCGGPAEVLQVSYCLSPGVQIRCIRCHASTQTLIAGQDPRTGSEVAPEDLRVRVNELWNRRASI